MNELEDIRVDWGFSFFFGRYTNELEDIRMNWASGYCFWKTYE